MIIVLTNMIDEIKESDYRQINNAINPASIKCPACDHVGMCRYGFYFRKVKNCSSAIKTDLSIQRLQCMNDECRRTHAVLPSTIVPYSQITMYETIEMIRCESDEEKDEILRKNILLDIKDIIRTKQRFTLYWRSIIAGIEPAMGDCRFFAVCIEKFKRHFMQTPHTLCSSYSCSHIIWDELPL